MAIDFPNSPTSGQTFTSGATTWSWDGTAWNLQTTTTASNDSMPVGSIMWFAGSTAPTGWILANGAIYTNGTYPNLYTAIGNTYGGVVGTSFAVPSVASTTGAYYIRYTTAIGVTTTLSLLSAPLGSMVQWPVTSSYPTGWVRSDGTAVSRTTYADLFTLIGTTYGAGDGSTTFNLPNMASAGAGSPVYIIKGTTSGLIEPSSVAHAASHARGGADVIDADRDQIDFVPTYYTRDSSPAQAGVVTDLTAHLKGLDTLAGSHASRHAAGGADAISIKQSQINDFVFTTEAARDAAITSPTEGMRAYITAPTVPAATSGGYTAVPTGIQTIYNGSSWVCITEVGAGRLGDTGYQAGSASYITTLTGDATAISVTLTTGTSANISISSSMYGGPSNNPWMSFSVSGATTVAAADSRGIVIDQPSAQQASVSATSIITGLTAGTNTFTLNYRGTGSAGQFVRRHIVVKGVA